MKKELNYPSSKKKKRLSAFLFRSSDKPSSGESSSQIQLSKIEPPQGEVDSVLLGTIATLIIFGVVMVYSASAIFADRMYGSGNHFLIRQSIFALLGITLMFVVSKVDYRRLRPVTYPFLLISVVLMLATVFGFGHAAGGARRWIRLGSFNIQPAEIAKIALIFWVAYSLSKKTEKMRSFSIGFLPHLLVAGFLMLLSLMQPDFGSAVMMGVLTFVLLFVAGARTGYILGAVLLALPMVWFLIAQSPYRMRRIKAFLAPFEHRRDEGYQVAESLISFGSGGVTGKGIGDSTQKLFFLPEAHTDFISAIVGEELGLIGVLFLICAFLLFLVRGIRASMGAPDTYGTYLGVGLTVFIALQAFTNLAVAMGMLPTKGLVLPFISYGGSSLMVNCLAVGVISSISRFHVKVPKKGTRNAMAVASEQKSLGLDIPLETKGEVLC